jgi:hypothetical protein
MNSNQPHFLGFRNNSESEKKIPFFVFETSNDPDSANKNKLLLVRILVITTPASRSNRF